jgi:hypothetical protein
MVYGMSGPVQIFSGSTKPSRELHNTGQPDNGATASGAGGGLPGVNLLVERSGDDFQHAVPVQVRQHRRGT